MSGDINIGRGRYEVRYRFSRDELRELGAKLAAVVQSVYDQKTAKAESAKAFAAEIEGLENQAARIVRALNEGAENREMQCEVWYNHPRPGVKTLRWQDHGEGQATREESMTTAEMQTSFRFEGDDSSRKQ
jgi:hypothetical protein